MARRGSRRTTSLIVALVAVAAAGLFGIDLPPELERFLGVETREGAPSGRDRAGRGTVERPPGLPATPSSFSRAKTLLYGDVYADRGTEFYCGCPFDDAGDVSFRGCGYRVRDDGERARRVEAEHIVPAYWIGYTRACWREKICTDSKGRAFKGRRCCEDVDPVFRTAHNDLFNLVPSVGEVNGDRSNYRYGMIPGEARDYGRCDFEVDDELRRAEPAPGIRGDVARASFYMEDTYGVALSGQQRRLFEAWSRDDPPDARERERNDRIRRIQGRGNRFIEGHPRPVAAR